MFPSLFTGQIFAAIQCIRTCSQRKHITTGDHPVIRVEILADFGYGRYHQIEFAVIRHELTWARDLIFAETIGFSEDIDVQIAAVYVLPVLG